MKRLLPLLMHGPGVVYNYFKTNLSYVLIFPSCYCPSCYKDSGNRRDKNGNRIDILCKKTQNASYIIANKLLHIFITVRYINS